MKYNLDFSGGENSWFDLWHIHTDLHGEGNKSSELRKLYLSKLLETFIELKSELYSYPHEFQVWMIINVEDSSDDGVYIHTKNPNDDNFPLKVIPSDSNQVNNSIIRAFINQTGLKVISVNYDDSNYIYLYDSNFGRTVL